jgi:N-acyl-D-amino-acid deacylase
MARMQAEVARALDQGAFGLSTGLIYPPGSFTSTEELIELTRVVGKRNRFYFSHIRGEAATLLDAVAEAIQIGRETGASVQISHFKAAQRENWDKSRQALDLIQQARSEGLDVTADLYPYTAGSTSLATLLPQWAHVGGPEKTISHLSDPEARKKMKADMQAGGFARGVEWDKVLITSSPVNTGYEGRNIAEMASESDKSGYDWLFDALLETRLDMGMAVFGMSEDNRRNELKYPDMMIGTDGLGMATSGPMAKGVPHPRSYGAFPRVIARYVRELKVLTLEETIYRMTGLAAAKLRLGDRGTIKPGNAADLVLFDPQFIADTATYEKPHQYAEGISHVIVNGQPVIKEAVHTGLRSGRILECS